MMKKTVLILIFFLLLLNTVFAVEKPQLYMPYPIIFVSGIGTKTDYTSKGSPSNIWPNRVVFEELGKHFLIHPEDKKSIESKYEFTNKEIEQLNLQPGEKPNLQFLFYDAQQATLATNADLLKNRINRILSPDGGYYKTSDYVYTEPCSTPKVILVCHSLGGLIARKMLVDNHDNIRDKVAAVFFIGTQQEGSPLGVIAYFLPKEIIALEGDLAEIDNLIDGAGRLRKRALINVREKENSKIIGNLQLMRWAERDDGVWVPIAPSFPLTGLYVSTRDAEDNRQLSAVLPGGEWPGFEEIWGLPKVTEKGVVKGTLINSNSANSYRHTFQAYSFNWPFGTGIGAKVVRSVPLAYELSEGVFSNPSVDRDIGDIKAHAIAGNSGDLLRLGFCAVANCFIGMDNFNQYDYSCIEKGFWDGGDGFANLASQKAIVPIANAHEIPASHGGELDYSETPNIILKAIDDAPVIESIEAISEFAQWVHPTYNYVTVKIKDYLLADIEIVDMRVNDRSVDLRSFLDPETETYKPYFKYGKDFLKQREDTDAPLYGHYLYLRPGEFWVKIDSPCVYNVYVKVRNAADKEASREKCFIYEVKNMLKTGKAGGTTEEGATWPAVKERAYTSFHASEKTIIDTAYADWFPWQLYILGIQASSSDNLYERMDEDGNTYIGHSFQAYISMYYGPWIIFKLTPPPEEIKSIKLVFSDFTELNPPYYGEFDILVYHDTSNSWPPTPASSADKLLLSYSNKETGYRELYIDPQDIGPGGYYVLQFRPDFQEYNCIPNPPTDVGAGFQRQGFVQGCFTGYWPNYSLFLEVELKSAETPN